MSRPLVLTLLLAACGASEGAPRAVPPQNKVATGTVEAAAKKQEQVLAEFRDQLNKDAHGLLKSFESRVYDPRRDGLLEHAEGEIDVRLDGRDSKYRFVYDAANKPEDPVAIEGVGEAAGVDAERLRRVRQWAILACCGPYGFVAFYVPPTPLLVVPASDPKSKNLVVWAQPFHGPLNASYSVDERQVVVSRGEWKDEKNKVVTNFDWASWHGRYVLARSAIVEGAATEFDYDDREGVNLLAKTRVGAGADVGQATFTYKSIRRRPR
jgi:hypothetical protein